MTIFQLLMLGASAYFAFKIYEHMQTLQEPEDVKKEDSRTADAFSIFSPESLIQRADEAFENSEYEKAFALLTEADAKDPKNPDTIFKMAYVLNEKGDTVSALNYYANALELDPKNEYIHNSMASIYRKNKEYASAKMHLSASIDIEPNNAVTYYNYGNLLVNMEYEDEAKVMYKKALEIYSDFTEAKEELEKLS